eukprot:m.479754 g.479754  ORF g.479754 m.479754 type:complete len:1079 (-) comp21602_c0_seq1:107-3343(-)
MSVQQADVHVTHGRQQQLAQGLRYGTLPRTDTWSLPHAHASQEQQQQHKRQQQRHRHQQQPQQPPTQRAYHDAAGNAAPTVVGHQWQQSVCSSRSSRSSSSGGGSSLGADDAQSGDSGLGGLSDLEAAAQRAMLASPLKFLRPTISWGTGSRDSLSSAASSASSSSSCSVSAPPLEPAGRPPRGHAPAQAYAQTGAGRMHPPTDVLVSGATAPRRWHGWVEAHGRRLDLALYVILGRPDAQGMQAVHGTGCDDLLRFWTVSGTIQLCGLRPGSRGSYESSCPPSPVPASRPVAPSMCALHLLNCVDQTVVDLRGSFEEPTRLSLLQGSSFAGRSHLVLGRFSLHLSSEPCDAPILELAMRRVAQFQRSLKCRNTGSMSPDTLAHVLAAVRLTAAAQQVLREQNHLSVPGLAAMSVDDLAKALNLPIGQAENVARVLEWLMEMSQAANLHHSAQGSGFGRALARLNVPLLDPLFFHACGLSNLLHLSVQQLCLYVSSPGAEASRMVAGAVPRVWPQGGLVSLSETMAASQACLQQFAARQPGARAVDLLQMEPAMLQAQGLLPIIAETFNFFKEFVMYCSNRSTVLGSLSLASALDVAVTRDCMASVHALLRVGNAKEAITAKDRLGLLNSACSDSMYGLLTKRLGLDDAMQHAPDSKHDAPPQHRLAPTPAWQQQQPPLHSSGGLDDRASHTSGFSSGSGSTYTLGSDAAAARVAGVGPGGFDPTQPSGDDVERATPTNLDGDVPPMFRWATMMLSAVSIGQIVVAAVMFTHMAVSGIKAGALASKCETPMLAIAIVAIGMFLLSCYRDCPPSVFMRLWRGSMWSYFREFTILVVAFFALAFAIGEAIKFILDACTCDPLWWHVAHLALHMLRTLALLTATGFHRAVRHSNVGHARSREFKQGAGEFHTSLVVFTIVSDLCFAVFFIFEMPRLDGAGVPDDPSLVTTVSPLVLSSGPSTFDTTTAAAAAASTTSSPLPFGPDRTTLFSSWHPGPAWVPMMTALWLIDLTVCLWFGTAGVSWFSNLLSAWREKRRVHSSAADDPPEFPMPTERTPLRSSEQSSLGQDTLASSTDVESLS